MDETTRSKFSDLAHQAMLLPKESFLEVARRKNSISIGIPKEISFQEKRIALTPLSVALLVNNGHEVVIETGAGLGSNFSDRDYSEQGGQIVPDAKTVYQSDIIIKVAPPTLDEIEMMKMGQTLISSIQLSSLKVAYLKALMAKKVKAISFEYLRDEEDSLTIVRAMSEIVGATSILIAAEYLSNAFQGKGLMLGGVTGVAPTEIVIIGAGTVGEFAARAALGLGAQIKVFDNSLYKLRRLQNNVGQRVYTSVIQPIVLGKALKRCDVAIGAVRASEGRSPCIVSEEMVREMKPDSVIIDISIDQGGCFETSQVTDHDHPVFRKYDITHYGVPNIASRVSRTASYVLTNIFTPILLDIGELGGLNDMLWAKPGVRKGVYIFEGHLTNGYLGEMFKIPHKELDLLFAARG
jgi:alanine dehydrogenase